MTFVTFKCRKRKKPHTHKYETDTGRRSLLSPPWIVLHYAVRTTLCCLSSRSNALVKTYRSSATVATVFDIALPGIERFVVARSIGCYTDPGWLSPDNIYWLVGFSISYARRRLSSFVDDGFFCRMSTVAYLRFTYAEHFLHNLWFRCLLQDIYLVMKNVCWARGSSPRPTPSRADVGTLGPPGRATVAPLLTLISPSLPRLPQILQNRALSKRLLFF